MGERQTDESCSLPPTVPIASPAVAADQIYSTRTLPTAGIGPPGSAVLHPFPLLPARPPVFVRCVHPLPAVRSPSAAGVGLQPESALAGLCDKQGDIRARRGGNGQGPSGVCVGLVCRLLSRHRPDARSRIPLPWLLPSGSLPPRLCHQPASAPAVLRQQPPSCRAKQKLDPSCHH